MAVEILTGFMGGSDAEPRSVLVCNTTGAAFGPVMWGDYEHADRFVEFATDCIKKDVRCADYDELMTLYAQYLQLLKGNLLELDRLIKKYGDIAVIDIININAEMAD